MAIVKSDQLTKIEKSPAEQNPARDEDARSRVMVYTFTSAAEAAASTIRLGTLRKGWRLLGMRATAPATFGAATATMSLGVSGTTAKYMALTDIAAALSADANHTAALFHGEVLAADTELIATTAVAALETGDVLTVAVRYSRD